MEQEMAGVIVTAERRERLQNVKYLEAVTSPRGGMDACARVSGSR